MFLLLATAATLGCRQPPQPKSTAIPVQQVVAEAKSTAIPVQQVVANAQNYAHQLITVRGCYEQGFETSTLRPCDIDNDDVMVWVERAETLYTLADMQNHLRVAVPKELKSAPKPDFVFQYNQTRSRVAWAKLGLPPTLPSWR
jgi:hypothetical protein